MFHINYYQLFQVELSETDNDVAKHANNQIILGIITLIGEMDFNELYADIFEECKEYKKLNLTDKINETATALQRTLLNEEKFSDGYALGQYNEQRSTPTTVNSAEVLERLLYHSLVLKSYYWDIHEKACLIFFKNNT